MNDEEKYILENINIEFEKNKKYVIVGNSGSGKTTLLKLILGIYKNFQGNIFVNKENIKNLPLTEWRKNITMIEQDVFFV